MAKSIIRLAESDIVKMVKEEIDKMQYQSDMVNMLFESSWSRVVRWMDDYDIAIITAFRGELKNIHNPQKTLIPDGMKEGDSFTLSQNREKNRQLKARLLAKDYGVTTVHGSYIEGIGEDSSKEVAEESFFVVNIKNNPQFFSDMFELSEYYNQDSFLYKPKDGVAVLVGTNDADYPGYGEEYPQGDLTSLPSKFMTRIKNACMAFVNKDAWIKRDKKSDLTKADMDDYAHSYSWTERHPRRDNDPYSTDNSPSFRGRKEERKKKAEEEREEREKRKNDEKLQETLTKMRLAGRRMMTEEQYLEYMKNSNRPHIVIETETQSSLHRYANDWRNLVRNNGVILETIDDYKGFSRQALYSAARGRDISRI